MNSLDPSFIFLNWERRSEEGFAYNLNYTYAGQEFSPGAGFIMREGVQGMSGQMLITDGSPVRIQSCSIIILM